MTATVTAARRQRGPVAPSPGAARLQPLQMSGVELVGPSMWADWRRRNTDVTIPLGIAALEKAGNLANLARLADDASRPHVGFPFSDTDVYKTLEAIAWAGQSAAPGTLGDFFAHTVALLEKVQAPDGMLNSYIQGNPGLVPYSDLAESHELYTAGHLIQAAVADRRMTGNVALFGVALRVADHLCDTFGAERRSDYDGHPGVETALAELYRESGDRRFLALARQFIDQRGHQHFRHDPRGLSYFQDRKPIRQELQIAGHAVRATYLEAGVVDVAVETDDTHLLESSLIRWHDMVTKKLYLTGGVGSRHKSEAFGDPYELPADRAYCETCAAIGSIHWSWRLLLATGESKYADLIERTIYNGLGAAVALDGRSFFYSNPLQVRADHEASDEEESGRRLPWYRCACCPRTSCGHSPACRTTSQPPLTPAFSCISSPPRRYVPNSHRARARSSSTSQPATQHRGPSSSSSAVRFHDAGCSASAFLHGRTAA